MQKLGELERRYNNEWTISGPVHGGIYTEGMGEDRR